MNLGVLETGPVAQKLVPKWGSYTDFFQRLLSAVEPRVTCQAYVCHEGEIPNDPSLHDGWIITGSKFGAYEDLPWIPPLEDFLRETYASKSPIAGICFGHQILAQALGGTVEKSPKGWGLGRHRYQMTNTPNWTGKTGGEFAAIAVHQDQVTKLPEDAIVIAGSDFCPIGALAYGDPEQPDAITVQAHPEFTKEFATDLIEVRRGTVFDNDLADQALTSLTHQVDGKLWAEFIVSFFRSAMARPSC